MTTDMRMENVTICSVYTQLGKTRKLEAEERSANAITTSVLIILIVLSFTN
jgi:hypothetical protein